MEVTHNLTIVRTRRGGDLVKPAKERCVSWRGCIASLKPSLSLDVNHSKRVRCGNDCGNAQISIS